MTREEAKKEWCNIHPLDLELNDLINTIYDKFEARKCINCRYFINDWTICEPLNYDIDRMPQEPISISDPKTFCCNNWEAI